MIVHVLTARSPRRSRTSLLCFIPSACLRLRGFETLSSRNLISESQQLHKAEIQCRKIYSVDLSRKFAHLARTGKSRVQNKQSPVHTSGQAASSELLTPFCFGHEIVCRRERRRDVISQSSLRSSNMVQTLRSRRCVAHSGKIHHHKPSKRLHRLSTHRACSF